MDLTDLDIFRAVVQAGGVTRAAEKLNRVQSNVTTRVRQLEADLGVELFIREGKKLHLSPEGKLLLDYADRLLDLAQEAREALQDAKPRGRLRLGSMESTASVRLPVPMNEYLSRYPEVSLELRIGTPRELAALVREGELDAALVAEPIADAPFEKISLYDEELVIVAAANHPPIKSPRDVNGRPVLAFEPGCPYRQRLEDWFAGSGEMSDRIIETSSYHAILGCAVAGMGISMVPRMVPGREAAQRSRDSAAVRDRADGADPAQGRRLAKGQRADRNSGGPAGHQASPGRSAKERSRSRRGLKRRLAAAPVRSAPRSRASRGAAARYRRAPCAGCSSWRNRAARAACAGQNARTTRRWHRRPR
jgi:DNA-binding transcriptional LysR family regulator